MKNPAPPAKIRPAQGGETLEALLAAMIRKSSEGGEILSESQILARAAEQGPGNPPEGTRPEIVRAVLNEIIRKNEDLHQLPGGEGGPSYYSSAFMTEAYARLLLRKQGDPLLLMAEIVRENSALYPRPVPLDLFTRPPFGRTPQEVLQDWARMGCREEYRDIVSTTTSTSRVFLYSTLHLEPDHASLLAEWLDVGQVDNP